MANEPIQSSSNNLSELLSYEKQIEGELMEVIMRHMEKREMTIYSAQKLAQDFITMLPATDKSDLLHKLNALSTTHTEAKEVYMKHISIDGEKRRQQALEQMRQHIESGDIDRAIAIAKEATK